MEYTKDQIPFLNILIKTIEDRIWMDLYHKATETKRCLPFTSRHPNHCKQNMPFSLGQRICTIAENNADHKNTYENLKKRQTKTSCHSLQHFIQITLIFIVLLSSQLIVSKIKTLAVFIIPN